MNIRDNLTEEEKQIYALITAAKDQGIITAYSDDGKYISCKLDDIKYEISLGFNPDSDHPSAERAIRASRFVTRLMDKIRKDYSCYFVQSEDHFYPYEEVLKNKLNNGRALQITNLVTHTQKAAGSDCFVSSYEIEVEIVASVGESYERMVDFLTVEMDSKGAVYTHKHINSPQVLTKSIPPAEMADAQKRANEILNFVLNGQLPGKRKDESIRKSNVRNILQALAQSNDSRFRAFLNRVSSKDEKVGQISLQPCSILIAAVDEKEYVYKASCGTETGELSVIWRSNLGEFDENTPLYLNITPSKKFIGLTNVKTSHPIKDFNSLVLAYKAEMKDGEVVITPDRWTLNDSYKQYINDYAVPIERDGVTRYFSNRYAVIADGKWRLKLDCKECALTGIAHYKGDLSNKYYLKNGKIEFGKIYTIGVQCFSCETCHKVIYYLGKDYLPYLSSHVMLDGKRYCDQCNDTVKTDDFLYRKTENVANGNKVGTVYALMDGKDFVPIENGGNVFICANCGKTVLYDKETEDRTCGICGEHICSHCANNSDDAPDRPLVINLSTMACRSCLSKETIARHGKEMKLYHIDDGHGKEQLYLDKAQNPDNIYHCVECGKLKFYDGNKQEQQKKCSACGRIICSSCLKNHPTDDNCLGLFYCKKCAEECTPAYNAAKNTAEASFQKLKNQEAQVLHAQFGAQAELKKHVADNIKKYLPFFCSEDRKALRKILRKKGNVLDRLSITCVSASALEKTVNYKFTIFVTGGRTYLFYRIKNKLIYGGIL